MPKLCFCGAGNREELRLDLPFTAGNNLLGYVTAEISFLGKLYSWSFEEDLGSEKPTQHRKREKQLPREEQPSEVGTAEKQRKCEDESDEQRLLGSSWMDVSELSTSLGTVPALLLHLSARLILISSRNLSGLGTCLKLQHVFAVALLFLTKQ